MATSRSASGGDALGIYIPFLGVLSEVAHGGASILNAVVGGDTFAAFDAVFGAEGNHAELGKVRGLSIEVGGHAAFPAPAEEKEDGGARLR